MLFIHWDPSPEIFTIPGIDWPVRWYGLMWALAFILTHFVMNRIYRTEGRTDKDLDTLTLYVILGTVLGARLGHCLFYDPAYYLSHPLDILKVYEGGLASHGGAIGILVAMWLYCRKTKESYLWLFDKMVVVAPLAAGLIRIGNLMNSEIIGTPTNVPWAFVFASIDNIPRHPAQLYEAIFSFILFFLFYYLWKRKREAFAPGYMFGLFCVLLFTERFFVEFLKENQEAFEQGMTLNMGQILSIPFILVGAYFMWRGKGKLEVRS
jgi:phosphatidylglycerol---prolipoprotein diacylglyceryl transferase